MQSVICVALVFKTVIAKRQIPDFKNFVRLVTELHGSATTR
jgi:hypothetical protein